MPLSMCPECEMAMEVKNFEDVLIDTCPSCRGVWLDRGELQKIIAHVRAQEAQDPSDFPGGAVSAPPRREAPHDRDRDRRDHRYDERRDRDDDRYDDRRRKKKKRFGLWDLIEDLIDD